MCLQCQIWFIKHAVNVSWRSKVLIKKAEPTLRFPLFVIYIPFTDDINNFSSSVNLPPRKFL